MSAYETQRKPILVSEGVRKVYRSGADSVVALHGLALQIEVQGRLGSFRDLYNVFRRRHQPISLRRHVG